MATEKQIYIKQIKRLQRQNAILAEVIAEERCLRQKAYAWYMKRLNSRFMWLFDLIGSEYMPQYLVKGGK
jgi:hypothetical protein